MTQFPVLSLITFLPLAGAGFIFIIRADEQLAARNARHVALWTTGITFVLSLFLWVNFDTTTAAFQFEEKATWMPGFSIAYHMGWTAYPCCSSC